MTADKQYILAIETSCDETGIAVLERTGDTITVLSNQLASQAARHAESGGVIPEVAAREHVAVIRPLLAAALKEAEVSGNDLSAIAVTVGPGLIPALAVGVTAARTLSYAWAKPLIPVHHLEGHIYSALLTEHKDSSGTRFTIPPDQELFPALALLVSGGHTMLVAVDAHLSYRILGQTRDDAVGEAFDKVGRLLGLPYPAGPHVSRLAQEGNPEAFPFTPPMQNSPTLDLSFSGLKTDVLYTLRGLSAEEQSARRADIAASFQRAAVQALVGKTQRALAELQPKTLLLAGGVAANTHLRDQLEHIAAAANVPLKPAPLWLCGDNAVMIGLVAAIAPPARQAAWPTVDAAARIPLEEFSNSLSSRT